MKTLEVIDIAQLDSVSGGQAKQIFSPCPAILSKTVGELSSNGTDLALAMEQCGVKKPSAKQLRNARSIRF